MPAHMLPRSTPALFSHVIVENTPLYRAILDVFAASKRQFRLHLRSDDVLAEAAWPVEPPTMETVQQALGQLVDWGNLQSQPDTARVATIEDFYRKRLLYRMTSGGEAVEAGLRAFGAHIATQAITPPPDLACGRPRRVRLRESQRCRHRRRPFRSRLRALSMHRRNAVSCPTNASCATRRKRCPVALPRRFRLGRAGHRRLRDA